VTETRSSQSKIVRGGALRISCACALLATKAVTSAKAKAVDMNERPVMYQLSMKTRAGESPRAGS
jgi:hypothetical protein